MNTDPAAWKTVVAGGTPPPQGNLFFANQIGDQFPTSCPTPASSSSSIPVARRSTRILKPPSWLNDYVTNTCTDSLPTTTITPQRDLTATCITDDVLIPRTIVLDPSGKLLLQWPIEEVETLRRNKVELSNQNLSKGEKNEIKGITAAQTLCSKYPTREMASSNQMFDCHFSFPIYHKLRSKTLNSNGSSFFCVKLATSTADVDVTFSFNTLDNAEPFDPRWDRYDAQKLCSQKGSTVQGGLGPFGLLTLASENLEEYTPVFFRVFKDQNKHLVLMCSDASRSTLMDGKSHMKNGNDAYRPSFAGFVNVDLKEKKLSLRSLSIKSSFNAYGSLCTFFLFQKSSRSSLGNKILLRWLWNGHR
ncbi:hypothetical protein DH2020_018513 [Rehmannia glutinosa]|uniref:Glycosyl hydrolase family 32 C-terminal domain-containing protein n=1 Tax=Rehmannia glutinosa TaxID=99300 RepID=A0ABR0WLX4_REHGL